MKNILSQYGRLLSEVDDWFRGCVQSHSREITCASGCSACCRGLFDITLLDACFLKSGFDQLPPLLRAELSEAAGKRLQTLSNINSGFVKPWLLNSIPECDWDELMPEDDETPCVLLSSDGRCLLYDYRPMTCRLNGIPLIDLSGEEFFDEWCTLNFTASDPRNYTDIRFPFMELFTRELTLFQKLVKNMTGITRNEVDMFIPAALVMEETQIVEAVRALES